MSLSADVRAPRIAWMVKDMAGRMDSDSSGVGLPAHRAFFTRAPGRVARGSFGLSSQTQGERVAARKKRARRPLLKAERILIKMPNWLGDAVMSLPAVEYVRWLFPHARIACLAKNSLGDLLRNYDALDAVLRYEHGTGVRGLRRKANTIRGLRRECFDLAVLLPNSFESALWVYLARIPLRVGYNTDGRGLLLTHAIPRKTPPVHQVRYYLDLCKALGEAEEPGPPRVTIPSRDVEWAKDFIAATGISEDELLIGLCPGAAYGPAKRWMPGGFIELSRRICEDYPAKFLVLGQSADAAPCATVAEGIGEGAINLCGMTTLQEVAAIIERCALIVANDSGALHLAAAIGTHVVGVFGPTDPARTAPLQNCTVIRKPVACSPCSHRECPGDFRCMTSVSAHEVYQKASEILSAAATKSPGKRMHRKF